jgi:hypothetical protein
MEKLNEVPDVETKFGGSALADEVYNDSEEIRIAINELITENQKLREAVKYLAVRENESVESVITKILQ